ncbi:hypothetical protein [Sorangium sp. So ce426]|uniref:hypothetical protein n=1 Tax=Sorangium sp. So ce426 TaxID=3133312 RepID=UPI003F5C749D
MVLDTSTYVREGEGPESEHDRWGEQIQRVAAMSRDVRSVVHVMDRDADDSGLFTQLIEQQQRFVFRLAHTCLLDVAVMNGAGKLDQILTQLKAEVTGDVELSA